MKSTNFEFLRNKWPELASLGGFAEQYVRVDPASALVKLRTFAEQAVFIIYNELRFPIPPFQPNLLELLQNDTFAGSVSKALRDKLHILRIQGNKAAHGGMVTSQNALSILQEAFNIARWLYVALAGGAPADLSPFQLPDLPEGVTLKDLERQRRELYRKVAAQEFEMQQLLEQLAEARQKAELAEKDSAELKALIQSGHKAADVLEFDEVATRKHLIDTMITAAGWECSNQSEVVCEPTVEYQSTGSTTGKADYVLKDDSGKPLAVIESKKTSIDAQNGRQQAKEYADGLEKMYGQRPVIFYTNGFETYIWNDAGHEPPRKVYGVYSKDSLQYLVFQREEKFPPDQIPINHIITDRMYQIEAIKRITEHFAQKRRKALIVQATGTGKTRVAISLCDVLSRARWVKRILFLCDRLELRKQAYNAFKEFLPGEPRTYVTATTAKDRDKRIYLATYPAMMKCFENFDVGFFDLIIADESHRSIYNRYREIFQYFDALQVGLTATPVNYIQRNTFQLFQCNDFDPTVHFSYQEAIQHKPSYLSRFEVESMTTDFLRKGIKYRQMTEEQRAQLEDDEERPDLIDYDPDEVDRIIFNKDTNRKILRNLMENGIRDATGTRLGKTIIFARNHKHAVLLEQLFDEMYPQYGGKFCQVIDNYNPRAEQLIDDFKGIGSNPDLTVAISVDMLDTGIDVPEVVNLVFAKPVRSYSKFWQMIGRGTRICPNLFGPGMHKTKFKIFDHWANFEFFEEEYKQAEPGKQKSLTQRLFEVRIDLAETALKEADIPTFDNAISLLLADIRGLPDKTIAVKEKWREVNSLRREEILKRFEGSTKLILRNDIAPLMQWRNISGHEAAHQFDLLVASLQHELLRKSAAFADYKDKVINQLEQLKMNLAQVKIKADPIRKVRSKEFWEEVTIRDLEETRQELRGIMQYRERIGASPLVSRVVDVMEDETTIERREYQVKLEGMDMIAYRDRVEKVLQQLFDRSEVLQKIKKGIPVSDQDLEDLCALVLGQDPRLDLHLLTQVFPEAANDLQQAVRSVIGLDAVAVNERFTQFVQKHPELNSRQIKFLDLLKNHIARYGSIELGRLYEPPFTTMHSDGIDGVFPEDKHVNELLEIVSSFGKRPFGEGAPA